MKKKATFIIPAYIKNEQYLGFLEQAIQGIMKQSDSDWNAIIMNNIYIPHLKWGPRQSRSVT